jgi:hypothetical protein
LPEDNKTFVLMCSGRSVARNSRENPDLLAKQNVFFGTVCLAKNTPKHDKDFEFFAIIGLTHQWRLRATQNQLIEKRRSRIYGKHNRADYVIDNVTEGILVQPTVPALLIARAKSRLL